tara:strand:- start:291 stop:455 length:165 start_codon:yes stop_codon:yes gene_type:complete
MRHRLIDSLLLLGGAEAPTAERGWRLERAWLGLGLLLAVRVRVFSSVFSCLRRS